MAQDYDSLATRASDKRFIQDYWRQHARMVKPGVPVSTEVLRGYLDTIRNVRQTAPGLGPVVVTISGQGIPDRLVRAFTDAMPEYAILRGEGIKWSQREMV